MTLRIQSILYNFVADSEAQKPVSIRRIIALIQKDLLLEWRQRYALNGLLLYISGATFIIYIGIEQSGSELTPSLWNVLWWIVALFTATNAMAKGFMQEEEEQQLYYYTIASAHEILLAKVIYNTLLMLVLGSAGFGLYYWFLPLAIPHPAFALCLLLGFVSFACSLTMIAAIASKAGNNSVLMAVLSFPVLIPQLLILTRASSLSLMPAAWSLIQKELTMLSLINIIVLGVAFVLFPLLWRS